MNEALKMLEESKMVSTSAETEMLKPTKLGALMSQHHLKLDTMRRVSRLAQTPSSISYLLQTIARCQEVQQHPLRRSEKKRLNQLNTDKIRYRVKSTAAKNAVNSTEVKSNILVQAGIGRLLQQDDPFHAEMQECLESSQRVLRGPFWLVCIRCALNKPLI